MPNATISSGTIKKCRYVLDFLPNRGQYACYSFDACMSSFRNILVGAEMSYERYFAMKSASFHSDKARNAIYALSFFLHVRDPAVDCIHWFNAPSRFCRSMFRFVFENKAAAICNGALVLRSNYSFFSLCH